MSNIRWQTNETGILRKKDERCEDLFVFGYSCKIFNDYDKALFIDQGKHLIPWMGDDTLKIDRYDCRGALSDLTPYIANSSNFDPWIGFTPEERKIEQLCDKERYRALTSNEEEENIYQEEELKRLHQALNNEKTYSEVGYNYDMTKTADNEQTLQSNEGADDNEPFVPSFEMDIPMGIKIPETKKQHGIIEKTALFINQQGAQMEVLLKIKQADNPQFQFLSFDNELYPYYRYLLTAVKNKHYKPESAYRKEISTENSRDEYLHPTLNTTGSSEISATESAPTIPTINYKPSADCSYSVLVNRIKERSAVSSLLEEIEKSSGRKLRSPSPKDNKSGKSDRSSTGSSISSARSSRSRSRSRSRSKSSSLERESRCPSDNSNAPVSSTVDDLYGEQPSSLPSPPPLPLSALSKSARRRRIRKEKQRVAAESYKIYYVEEQQPVDVDDDKSSKQEVDKEDDENPEESYDSDVAIEGGGSTCSSLPDKLSSTSTITNQVPAPAAVVYVPPSDIQLIIDKMASYVAKNGRDFENIVRGKGDPRFSFLEPVHMYNPYYNQKVELYLQLDLIGDTSNSSEPPVKKPAVTAVEEEVPTVKPSTIIENNGDSDVKSDSRKSTKSSKSHKQKPLPICFSIKKPRDQETLEVKSALPNEESEDESNEASDVDDDAFRNDKSKTVQQQKSSSASKDNVKVENEDSMDAQESSSENKQAPSDTVVKKSTISAETWAKERLKAKLVMTAKGKIAAKEKDKQLQAERRRKAAQFISLLQKENLMANIQLSTANMMAESMDKNSANSGSKDEIISIGSSSTNSDSDVAITKVSSGKSSKRHGISEKSGKHKRRKKYHSSGGEDEDYKKRRVLTSSRHKTYKRKKDHDRHKKSHKKRKKQHHKDDDTS